MVIKYTSENGYTGMLYGTSSYKVMDPEGTVVFHTCARTINTEAELKADVDDYPEFKRALMETYKKLADD